MQTEHTTPPQIFAIKGSFRRKGVAIQLPRVYLFSFTRQGREAKSRRRKRLPPTTPEKVKEGSTQEQHCWNRRGPFKLSRGKISLFKLQSSLQHSTFTNLMIKGRKKSFETYEEPSVRFRPGQIPFPTHTQNAKKNQLLVWALKTEVC